MQIEGSRQSIASLVVPDDASGKQIHIILEVTDNDADAPLTSYRRIVIDGQEDRHNNDRGVAVQE